MQVECPKCAVRGLRPRGWHATGRFNQNRFGRTRAELVCDGCGYAFSSGLQAALQAGAAERGDCELPSPEACPVPVPQPTLPIPGAHTRRDHGFVSVKQIAARAVADFKSRATGEKD